MLDRGGRIAGIDVGQSSAAEILFVAGESRHDPIEAVGGFPPFPEVFLIRGQPTGGSQRIFRLGNGRGRVADESRRPLIDCSRLLLALDLVLLAGGFDRRIGCPMRFYSAGSMPV